MSKTSITAKFQKAKTKKTVISNRIIRFNIPKSSKSKLLEKLPAQHRLKAAAALKYVLLEIKQHYKSDDWNLDFRFYHTYLLDKMFGTDFSDFLIYSLVNAGYTVQSGERGLEIVYVKSEKKPKRSKRA